LETASFLQNYLFGRIQNEKKTTMHVNEIMGIVSLGDEVI